MYLSSSSFFFFKYSPFFGNSPAFFVTGRYSGQIFDFSSQKPTKINHNQGHVDNDHHHQHTLMIINISTMMMIIILIINTNITLMIINISTMMRMIIILIININIA